MLKGHRPQAISKELNVCDATVYNDIKFLSKKSQEYLYDLAKGTHVLMYQKVIESIGLTLSKAWDKFNDPTIPEKQKVSYLKLTKECSESMFALFTNGPVALSVQNTIIESGLRPPSGVYEKWELNRYLENTNGGKDRKKDVGGNGNGAKENEVMNISNNNSSSNTNNLEPTATNTQNENDGGNGGDGSERVLITANDPALTSISTSTQSTQSAQSQLQSDSAANDPKLESESSPKKSKSKSYFYDFTDGSITKV